MFCLHVQIKPKRMWLCMQVAINVNTDCKAGERGTKWFRRVGERGTKCFRRAGERGTKWFRELQAAHKKRKENYHFQDHKMYLYRWDTEF
jgi:hypothetical protein